MKDQNERCRLLLKLRSALEAICAVSPDMEDWPLYVQAVGCGADHLAARIPPTAFPTLRLKRYPKAILSELTIAAAMPVSLYNSLLDCSEKLGFSAFRKATGRLESAQSRSAFELLSYWHHDLIWGRDLPASLNEIVFEDQFLSRSIRGALKMLKEAHNENRLSREVLAQAVRGQARLLTKVIASCYLCLAHPTFGGIQREAVAMRLGGFEVANAIAMHAIILRNYLDANHSTEHPIEKVLFKIESGSRCI